MIVQLNSSAYIQLVGIINAVSSFYPSIGGLKWPPHQLAIALKLGQVYGLYKQQHIASFIILRNYDHAIEIDYLATHPNQFGEGKMSSIFNYLKSISQEKSKPIWLEVSFKNKMAISFYEKLGFDKVGERKNYYKNGQTAYIYSYLN